MSPPDLERLKGHECSAAIWSRWPIELIEDPVPHRRGTVAGLVHAPFGTVLVYAAVIPWANDPNLDDGRPARKWEAHLAGIERLGAEWRCLRHRFPNVPMVVAGDLNQDRDGSGWYGTKAAREQLGVALAQAGLTCLTEMDVVADGLLETDHLVDHICATDDLSQIGDVRCWEKIDDLGQLLSDHPTVALTLAPRSNGADARRSSPGLLIEIPHLGGA